MVAVVARHAEKSELFDARERAHPTNERNKLENSVCVGLQITGVAISPVIVNPNGLHGRADREMQVNLIASA
jgi:hypothetical protein